MPGFAVYLHGNNHIIEYNNIYDAVKEVSDAGAFYMGRDISEVGNVLKCNYFHHIKKPSVDSGMGVCAVYFDDGSSFNQVYSNYFSDIEDAFYGCVFWNRGCETSVSSNIFFDCKLPIRTHFSSVRAVRKILLDENSIQYKRAFAKEDDYKGVDITSENYKKAYPYLYDLYTGDYIHGSNIWNNFTISDKEREFVDYKNGDYTLKDSCIPYRWVQGEIYDTVLGMEDGKIRTEKIDFKSIGINKK